MLCCKSRMFPFTFYHYFRKAASSKNSKLFPKMHSAWSIRNNKHPNYLHNKKKQTPAEPSTKKETVQNWMEILRNLSALYKILQFWKRVHRHNRKTLEHNANKCKATSKRGALFPFKNPFLFGYSAFDCSPTRDNYSFSSLWSRFLSAAPSSSLVSGV